MKAAGQEVKPEPSEACPTQDIGRSRHRFETSQPVGRSLSVDAGFYFQWFSDRDRAPDGCVITNQPTQEVYPDSPTRWSTTVGSTPQLEFKLTKTGPAKSLVLHQNGTDDQENRNAIVGIDSRPMRQRLSSEATTSSRLMRSFVVG